MSKTKRSPQPSPAAAAHMAAPTLKPKNHRCMDCGNVKTMLSPTDGGKCSRCGREHATWVKA